MKTCLLLIFLAVFSGVSTNSPVRSGCPCKIASNLYRHGIRENLENWVCLVQNESGGRTNAVGGPNYDGSYDYGIFQINSKYWCGVVNAGGDCNIRCDVLLDVDITDDVNCARKIFSRHGFKAWYGWMKHCTNGQPLPNLSKCQL